jgi:hypothetical protein
MSGDNGGLGLGRGAILLTKAQQGCKSYNYLNFRKIFLLSQFDPGTVILYQKSSVRKKHLT